MNKIETQRFNDAYSRYEAGDYSQALQELRDLASGIVDPWDKTELLYYKTMFLVEMCKILEARQCLDDLKQAVASLAEPPPQGNESDLRNSLPAMARHAELRVMVAEEKTLEALRFLEDWVSRYPKELSTPEFRTVLQEVGTMHGILLADAGRWEEARPFLEDANPPESWKGTHAYYLGQCYYELKNYERAKEKLVEALNLGLKSSWESQAHYILGLIEYNLSDMRAAKYRFELSVKTADTKSLNEANIDLAKTWAYLEATSRALGLQVEAENYRRLRAELPPKSKVN